MSDPRKPRPGRLVQGGLRTALPFLLPSMAGMLVFSLLPLLISACISLTDWNGLDQLLAPGMFAEHFVGLGNFQAILSGKEFWQVTKLGCERGISQRPLTDGSGSYPAYDELGAASPRKRMHPRQTQPQRPPPQRLQQPWVYGHDDAAFPRQAHGGGGTGRKRPAAGLGTALRHGGFCSGPAEGGGGRPGPPVRPGRPRHCGGLHRR